ncbi:MAG: DUF2231 domain-containing protein [Pseudomonadota bacterium]
MRKWKCLICKYTHEGDAPPEKCPVCKAPASKFVEVEPEAAAPKSKIFDMVAGLMSRRHAHPISVHFPNGVSPVALMMFLLAWLFDATTLATAGFYNIIFVMFALPFVIFTGFLDWGRKYRKALTPIFQVKIVAASITFVACLISLTWYLIDPGVIRSSRGWLFIVINLVMVAAAGVAGHIGGKLVFKD